MLKVVISGSNIYCHVRNKFYVKAPEEIVRQSLICRLVNEFNYPLNAMEAEFEPAPAHTRRGSIRTDLAVWKSFEDRVKNLPPFIIIETKARNAFNLSDYTQAFHYTSYCRSQYMIVAGSGWTEFFKVQTDVTPVATVPVDTIPFNTLSDTIYDTIGDFSNNRAVVIKDQKYGLIDELGNTVLEPCYKSIKEASDAGFKILDDSGWFISNINGVPKHETRYTNISAFLDNQAKVTVNELVGILTNDGIELVPPKYSDVTRVVNGYARVSLNSLWGVVNNKGVEIIPIKYNKIIDVSRGYFKVQLGTKYGIYNTQGVCLLPEIFDDIAAHNQYDLCKIQKNGLLGIASKNFQIISECKYSKIEFIGDYIKIQEKGAWGFLDLKGREVLKPIYEVVGKVLNGEVQVKLNNVWTKVNIYGNNNS